MRRIVTVTKKGTNLPIEVDVARIVAITAISEKNEEYYIYFENAIWAVKPDTYEVVRTEWLNS